MLPQELIRRKRDGDTLSAEEIAFIVDGITTGRLTEGQIAATRATFNESVQRYNTARESFPTNLVANATGFAPAQLFELGSEKERQVPGVSF